MVQFPLAERATAALGVVVWPMVQFEADDALATAAARWASADGVEQVVICSPDKDLAQCVRGTRVVCLDRMRRRVLDEAGVIAKFGVSPASIADWLALVGDDADGIPGIPGWGAKSAATLLARYGHIEAIPDDPGRWDVSAAAKLAGASPSDAGRASERLAGSRGRPLTEGLTTPLAWRARTISTRCAANQRHRPAAASPRQAEEMRNLP
jgi:5'-3' exonuclease